MKKKNFFVSPSRRSFQPSDLYLLIYALLHFSDIIRKISRLSTFLSLLFICVAEAARRGTQHKNKRKKKNT